jgi:hypothetical protein
MDINLIREEVMKYNFFNKNKMSLLSVLLLLGTSSVTTSSLANANELNLNSAETPSSENVENDFQIEDESFEDNTSFVRPPFDGRRHSSSCTAVLVRNGRPVQRFYATGWGYNSACQIALRKCEVRRFASSIFSTTPELNAENVENTENAISNLNEANDLRDSWDDDRHDRHDRRDDRRHGRSFCRVQNRFFN